jgi:hypothetical protein
MELFKKHVDTVIILTAFATAILWMNGRFNEVDRQFGAVDKKFAEVHQELAVIKTVLIMKNIMPVELAVKPEQ